MFQAISITEHSDGIALTPIKERKAEFAETAQILKEIPQLGLLEIAALRPDVIRQLPQWRGTSVRHGELFQDTLGKGNDPYFVLASRSALAVIIPDAEQASEVPRLVNELTVDAFS